MSGGGWWNSIKQAISDRDAARRERSTEVLARLMTLPKEQRFEVTVEELNELTSADRRRFLASLAPQARISIGVPWAGTIALAAAGMVVAAGVTLAVVWSLGAGPGDLGPLDPTERAVVEAMRSDAARGRIAALGREDVLARLSLSAEDLRLPQDLAANRAEFERLGAVVRGTKPAEWVDVARFLTETGPEGAAFVRFVLSPVPENNTFVSSLFALIPGQSADRRIEWRDTMRRIIRAMVGGNPDTLVFASEAENKVGLLAAMERLDVTRREAVLKVLGAPEADIRLIAQRGLPLPLAGDQRAAYDAILRFRDPDAQIPACLRGAELPRSEWQRLEWAQSPDGQAARRIMEAWSGAASQDSQKPCIVTYRPGTPEWRRIGAWTRGEGANRKELTMCLVELP